MLIRILVIITLFVIWTFADTLTGFEDIWAQATLFQHLIHDLFTICLAGAVFWATGFVRFTWFD